jgi:hypothetical protein
VYTVAWKPYGLQSQAGQAGTTELTAQGQQAEMDTDPANCDAHPQSWHTTRPLGETDRLPRMDLFILHSVLEQRRATTALGSHAGL